MTLLCFKKKGLILFIFGYNLSKYCKLPWVDCLGDWDTLVILGGGQYRVDYFTSLILSWPHFCQPSSVCAFSLYFWFKYDSGQKYYALQVQSDQGLNSWPVDHESTLHVAEMPALTAQPSVTFNAIQEDTSNVYKHCRQANYSIWIDLSWQNSIIHLCILRMYLFRVQTPRQCMFNRLYLSPGKVGANAACN